MMAEAPDIEDKIIRLLERNRAKLIAE